MTSRTSSFSRPRWVAATVFFVLLVLVMTLRPDSTVNTANFVPFREHGAAWSCLLSQCRGAAASARFLISDVIGNVVVFVPIGFAGAGALSRHSNGKRFMMATAGGLLLSLCIETVQYQIATRATDVDDIIFNTLGTAIGAGALIIWQGRASKSSLRDSRT